MLDHGGSQLSEPAPAEQGTSILAALCHTGTLAAALLAAREGSCQQAETCLSLLLGLLSSESAGAAATMLAAVLHAVQQQDEARSIMVMAALVQHALQEAGTSSAHSGQGPEARPREGSSHKVVDATSMAAAEAVLSSLLQFSQKHSILAGLLPQLFEQVSRAELQSYSQDCMTHWASFIGPANAQCCY